MPTTECLKYHWRDQKITFHTATNDIAAVFQLPPWIAHRVASIMFESVHLILVVSSLLQASALCLAAVLRAIGYLLLLLVSEVDPSQFFLGGPIMRRCCCCSVKTGAVLLGNSKLHFHYITHDSHSIQLAICFAHTFTFFSGLLNFLLPLLAAVPLVGYLMDSDIPGLNFIKVVIQVI